MELTRSLTNSKILKTILIVFIGSIVLTISAKINVPFYPVPMTMQTFVVIFIGMAFGWKLGLATVFAYLVEGAFGFPVFAGTPEKGIGIAYMIGPTGGYLFGFLVAVFIAGFLNFDKNIFLKFILITTAVSTIYIFGVPWLALLKGWQVAYVWGIKKFLLAELFKICLLTVISKQSLKLRKFI
jgi:biotin transport system substrate-specific component